MSETRQTKEDIAALKERFVAYYRDVPVQKYAAMYIGRTEQCVIGWMKQDKDFFNKVQEARADWVKKQVFKARAEFKLERMEKEIFAERKEQDININPVKDILEALNLKKEDFDGQTEDSAEASPTD